MSVFYGLSQHPDPRNPQGPKKFYAHVKTRRETTTRELATQISKRTGMSVSDVIATIEAFIDIIPELAIDSEIVRLGDFGSFSVSISSEGVEKEEDFKPSLIRECRLNFRPGNVVQKMLDSADYEKG